MGQVTMEQRRLLAEQEAERVGGKVMHFGEGKPYEKYIVSVPAVRKVLHAGCGHEKISTLFDGWDVTRLDIDKACNPDIVASIVAMPMIEAESFDAVYCAHTLEHLFAHDALTAIREFARILKPEGILVLVVPDLQAVGRLLAADRTEGIAYRSEAGPVTALDMLYGMRSLIGNGHLHYQHRTGFSGSSIRAKLEEFGFHVKECKGDETYNLVAVGIKQCQPFPKVNAPI